MDAAFYADIILTFWSGYDKGFDVIMDKKKIAAHYLKTWFLVDFIATVNWSTVIGILFADKSGESVFVSMLRLVKVFRLARAGRIIKRITQSSTIHTKFIDAINFFLYVVIVCHLLACLFYLLPKVLSCQIDQDTANAAFLSPDSSTKGWGMDDDGPDVEHGGVQLFGGDAMSCMQGSWRQSYGLEARCEVCSEVEKNNYGLTTDDDTCDGELHALQHKG